MKVVWTRQSRDDLRRIRRYIAGQAPRTAQLFVARLIDSVGRLEIAPEQGGVVQEWNDPSVREIFFGNYRIVYRVGKRIDIITVFHGAMQLGAPWQYE